MKFRAQQLGLCGLVLLAFTALLELGERSSGFFDLVTYSDANLLRYRAGATIRWGREGYGVTNIGPYGMIGSTPQETGAQILFLGDSLTEALQVNEDEKFTALTQQRYNRNWPQQQVTTLNFAMSGVSAVQHAADLAGLRRITQPRVVVVQVGLDDFLPQAARTTSPTQPAFLKDGPDGNFTLSRAPFPDQNSRSARLKQRLIQWRLYSVYARVSWRLQNFLRPGNAPAEDNAPVPAVAPSLVAAGEKEPDERRRVMQFLLRRMKDECQAAGAQLVFLYISRIPQLQRGRILWDESEAGPQVVAERELFLEVAREMNVPVWNPTARLRQFARETGRLPYGFANNRPGFGHLNQDGHSVMADFIVDELHPLLQPAN